MNTSITTTPVLICVALLSVGCGDTSSDTVEQQAELRALEDGLLLHWTFEDRNGNQILDVSGNGRHGTLQGGGTFVSSPVGEALSLDGVDDWVSFAGPRSPDLYGGIDGDFTISARVKVADVGKYNTLCYGCGPFSVMYVGTASPTFGPRSMSGLWNQSTNGTLWPWTSQALVNDTWVDVTMVVEDGAVARHYLDCELDLELANANSGLKNYNSSSLGKGTAASNWYEGEVDDLRVWSRALSEAEITEICPPALCKGPIHVDVDAASGGDGLAWASAFDTLQTALDTAQQLGCTNPEIWVAEGTYAPDPAVPVVTISQPLAIYGGFAGSETSLDQRNVDAHPVVLGGDGWQSRVVVIEPSALDDVELLRLDGLTISGSDAGAIEVDAWDSGGFNTLNPTVTFQDLVITNNSAVRGAGILAEKGIGAIRIVDSHFEGNVASEAGAAIYHGDIHWIIEGSSFVANQSPGATIREVWELGLSHFGHVELTDSLMSNNVGGAVRGAFMNATNTVFSGNTATYGGAIHISEGSADLVDCELTNNQATNYGGAIFIENLGAGSYDVVGTSFAGNTAKWGGAIYLKDTPGDPWKIHLDVAGSEFSNNTASSGGGGAIYLQESNTSVVSSVFVDNTARFGGAIHVDDWDFMTPTTVEVIGSRFIANEATVSGGGIMIEEPISVTDTEFVANVATTGGGGAFGRATYVGVTFANNTAPTGRGLYAPSGAQMTLRNVVAWPDTLVATSMFLDHSCTPNIAQAFTSDGWIKLVADPFAPADLDLDGRTEFYLDPSSPCVDIGGTVSEFDWSVETTQASQCTDVTPVDAGVHYTPISSAGPC